VVTSKLSGLKVALDKRRDELISSLADAGYDTSRFTARHNATTDNRVYYDENGNPKKKP
jgi:hypothetical protein